MSDEPREPQWLREFRDEILEREESDRELELRDMERADERSAALWMVYHQPETEADAQRGKRSARRHQRRARVFRDGRDDG